jgi:hypothetical protein
MASLFSPDGRYMREVPCWLNIKPLMDRRTVQIVLPLRFPVQQYPQDLAETRVEMKTITLEVGQYQNGAWKFRFADIPSLQAFEERQAQEERW